MLIRTLTLQITSEFFLFSYSQVRITPEHLLKLKLLTSSINQKITFFILIKAPIIRNVKTIFGFLNLFRFKLKNVQFRLALF